MARELGNKLGKWNKERAAAGKPSVTRDAGENASEIQNRYFTHIDDIFYTHIHAACMMLMFIHKIKKTGPWGLSGPTM